MSYPLPSDPQIAAYLQHLRERNVRIASVCKYCEKQSTGINSAGYEIIFVCQDHYIEDNPHVVHRVYPQGMSVNPDMMDPNIGGSFVATEPVENSPE
jgi:hypothetical protein